MENETPKMPDTVDSGTEQPEAGKSHKEPGRPLKFQTPEELQGKIEEYFSMCDETVVKRILNKNQEIIAEITKPYTITGMAEYLGTNRQTLINYEAKDNFFDTIKRAKAKIEAAYEERALLGDNNPVVSIFTLKNNFNWKDKSEVDNNVRFPIPLDDIQEDDSLPADKADEEAA